MYVCVRCASAVAPRCTCVGPRGPNRAPRAPRGPYRAPRAPRGGRPSVGPVGPQGPQEGTGGTPRGTGTPPEARGAPQKPRGHFWKKSFFGLRPASPSNPEKVSKNRLPSLWDPSQSIRAAFLVRVGTKNPSRASTATHFGPQPSAPGLFGRRAFWLSGFLAVGLLGCRAFP